MKISKKEQREYLEKMEELAEWGDTEIAHSRADEILIEMLKKLGYTEIVKAWHEVPKWYA